MFIFILINVISFFVCVKIYTSSLNYKYSTVSYLFFCCILVLVVGFRAENVVNSTLAVSNIRNRTYTNCEVYLIDYGYGNFKEKIHFME